MAKKPNWQLHFRDDVFLFLCSGLTRLGGLPAKPVRAGAARTCGSGEGAERKDGERPFSLSRPHPGHRQHQAPAGKDVGAEGEHERAADEIDDQMLLVDQGQRGGKADVTSPHDRSDQSTRSA